ncbi:MAG: LapA family protein [Rhizobiaceae bacterium]
MINRLVVVLILLPIAIVLIALAVANRGLAPFTIDPFNPGNPALTMELPLFVWLFAALALGVLIGSATTWFKQGSYRRAARENKRQADTLRQQAKAKPEVGNALPAPGE